MASLIVGSISLSTYMMLHPEEGLDPAPVIVEPSFAESAISDGAALIQETYSNREWEVPVHLKASSKDNLHDLARDVERNLQKGARVAWMDDGATDTSYFDLEAGRLEIEYSQRRGMVNRGKGKLRLWTRPFAHSATERVMGTGMATTQVVSVFSMPSVLDGDVPAQSRITLTGASEVVRDGRLVAVSRLPDVNWQAIWQVASQHFSGLGLGTISANSVGSRYLAQFQCGLVPLAPGIYQGRRIRALAIARGGALQMYGPDGQAVGQRGIASVINGRDWGVADLGVFTVPEGSSVGSQSFVLRGDRFVGTSGFGTDQYGQFVNVTNQDVALTALCLIPEDESVFVADHRVEPVAMDRFRADTPVSIVGRVESEGYSWGPPTMSPAFAGSTSQAPYLATRGYLVPVVGGSIRYQRFGAQLVNVPSLSDMRIESTFGDSSFNLLSVPSALHGVFKASPSGGAWSPSQMFVSGELVGQGSNGYLALMFHNGAGTFLAASTAIPSMSLFKSHMTLNLAYNGSHFLSLEDLTSGSLIASIAGAVGTVFVGQPGLYYAATTVASYNTITGAFRPPDGFRVSMAPPQQTGQRDRYLIDSVAGLSWRETSASAWDGDLQGLTRGRPLTLNAPTTAAIFAMAMPFNEGSAHGRIDLEVRVRERWSYMR